MSTQPRNAPSAEQPTPFPPQGHIATVPYDWRRPSLAREKARTWNPNDPRLFPPRSFGIGWAINFYWVIHLESYVNQRRSTRP